MQILVKWYYDISCAYASALNARLLFCLLGSIRLVGSQTSSLCPSLFTSFPTCEAEYFSESSRWASLDYTWPIQENSPIRSLTFFSLSLLGLVNLHFALYYYRERHCLARCRGLFSFFFKVRTNFRVRFLLCARLLSFLSRIWMIKEEISLSRSWVCVNKFLCLRAFLGKWKLGTKDF